jgi:outer membrane protein TolC
MWQAGVRSKLDVLQTETEIVAEKEQISNLYSEKTILQNELISLLGITIPDSLQLKPVKIDSIINIPLPETDSETIANNPLLTLYNSKIKAREYQVEEVDAGKMPHLMLGSSYTIDGDPTNDGNYVGINAGVAIPVYYGKEFKYRKQFLENNISSLQSQKQDAEQELTIKLEQAREKLVQLKSILLIQYKKIEIAKATANYAEINYKAGIATNLDFLSAQQILISSELATEETLLKYSMGLIDYYMITAQVQNIISLGNIE